MLKVTGITWLGLVLPVTPCMLDLVSFQCPCAFLTVCNIHILGPLFIRQMISLKQKNKRFCSEQCDLERIQPALLYAASPEVAPNSQKQPGKDDLLALWVKSGDLKQKYKPYFQEKSIHEDDLSGPGQGGG